MFFILFYQFLREMITGSETSEGADLYPAQQVFTSQGVPFAHPLCTMKTCSSLLPVLYLKTNIHKIGNMSRRSKSEWTTYCKETYSFSSPLVFTWEQISGFWLTKPTAAGFVDKWHFKKPFRSRFLVIPPGKELISSTCEGAFWSLLSRCLNCMQTK